MCYAAAPRIEQNLISTAFQKVFYVGEDSLKMVCGDNSRIGVFGASVAFDGTFAARLVYIWV